MEEDSWEPVLCEQETSHKLSQVHVTPALMHAVNGTGCGVSTAADRVHMLAVPRRPASNKNIKIREEARDTPDK